MPIIRPKKSGKPEKIKFILDPKSSDELKEYCS